MDTPTPTQRRGGPLLRPSPIKPKRGVVPGREEFVSPRKSEYEESFGPDDSGVDFSLDRIKTLDLSLSPSIQLTLDEFVLTKEEQDVVLAALQEDAGNDDPEKSFDQSFLSRTRGPVPVGLRKELDFGDQTSVADTISLLIHESLSSSSSSGDNDTSESSETTTPLRPRDIRRDTMFYQSASVSRGESRRDMILRGVLPWGGAGSPTTTVPFRVFEDDGEGALAAPAMVRFRSIDATKNACHGYGIKIFSMRRPKGGNGPLVITRSTVTRRPTVRVPDSGEECVVDFSHEHSRTFFNHAENIPEEVRGQYFSKGIAASVPVGVVTLNLDFFPNNVMIARGEDVPTVDAFYLAASHEPVTVLFPESRVDRVGESHFVIELVDVPRKTRVATLAISKSVFARLLFLNMKKVSFSNIPIGRTGKRVIKSLVLDVRSFRAKGARAKRLLVVEITNVRFVVGPGFERHVASTTPASAFAFKAYRDPEDTD